VGKNPTPGTSVSLLERLRLTPDDPDAWSDFVERYATVIYDWCRQWNLQDADAQDVTQVVMLKLVQRLRTFEYDPRQSFRSWLRTVAHNAWIDFVAERSRSGANGVELSYLNGLPSRDDLLKHLDAEFDREVLEEAYARVRVRVAPQTWEAFRLTALENVSGADAAQQLGTSVTNVFKAKSNVLKMLGEEVRRLEGTEASRE
jgi:RNA polymerase sigma factor (sigma-70 family)